MTSKTPIPFRCVCGAGCDGRCTAEGQSRADEYGTPLNGEDLAESRSASASLRDRVVADPNTVFVADAEKWLRGIGIGNIPDVTVRSLGKLLAETYFAGRDEERRDSASALPEESGLDAMDLACCAPVSSNASPCRHHLACEDCFSASFVRTLKASHDAALAELLQRAGSTQPDRGYRRGSDE